MTQVDASKSTAAIDLSGSSDQIAFFTWAGTSDDFLTTGGDLIHLIESPGGVVGLDINLGNNVFSPQDITVRNITGVAGSGEIFPARTAMILDGAFSFLAELLWYNDNITGSRFNDLIYTGAGGDLVAGGDGADEVHGEFGQDWLDGGAGNDTLDGGPDVDLLVGGTGDDLYLVNAGDQVLENPSEGTDTVESTATRTLGENFENLTLAGPLAVINGTGNGLGNVMIGNPQANLLSGLGGVDTLSGLGGDDTLDGGGGADRMDGGTGNDTYVIDNAGDVAGETAAGGGVDGVISSKTHILGANLETLTLTGSGGIAGTGNAAANAMTGNAGGNRLAGLGGKDSLGGLAGNDTLDGGAGDDRMTGGGGKDILIGGAGKDVFDFDAIADSPAGGGRDALQAAGGKAFELAGDGNGDRIDVSGIDADITRDGQQAFVFGGSGKGHIWCTNSGSTTRVLASVDNDAAAEFELDIPDGAVLADAYTTADFILT